MPKTVPKNRRPAGPPTKKPKKLSLLTALGAKEWFQSHPVKTLVNLEKGARSVHITTNGEPQAQACLCYNRNGGLFDPQGFFKAEFRRLITTELGIVGSTCSTFFPNGTHLRVNVVFCLGCMDQKDVDNLLKLILVSILPRASYEAYASYEAAFDSPT